MSYTEDDAKTVSWLITLVLIAAIVVLIATLANCSAPEDHPEVLATIIDRFEAIPPPAAKGDKLPVAQALDRSSPMAQAIDQWVPPKQEPERDVCSPGHQQWFRWKRDHQMHWRCTYN